MSRAGGRQSIESIARHVDHPAGNPVPTSGPGPKDIAMYPHPDLMLTIIHDRQADLIAYAERRRLLCAGRRYRTTNRADTRSGPAARSRTDGTLAECATRAVAPAR
jgi:hypothetical protein